MEGPQGSAATPFAVAPSGSVRFPGEDSGHSLAEMAQRDLDAALQLLADRAQYITGASGAAIALRRDGRNDMLCRASTGSNAPELGALLSTEFGLSGESVRTGKALRCDDAERDARVNRDVCRQLGIASVVVMPVVHDDEVLGVFELFSGHAHAFGDRDITAIKRLSDMVETAVRMALAAQSLPERLNSNEPSLVETADEETILDVEVPENQVVSAPPVELLEEPVFPPQQRAPATGTQVPCVSSTAIPLVAATVQPANPEATENGLPKKPLFWSAAASATDVGSAPAADQSHVPPVLRSLRKCEACGFPVSTGRVFCVECEEKNWRGQLRRP
jgi:GAF domain-containing protein